MTVVVSLSHQAIASFATLYEIGFQESADRLSSFLKSLGVDCVFDLTLARHLALIEATNEYLDVWTQNRGRDQCQSDEKRCLPILSTVCPGWVCYAEKTQGTLVPLLSRVKSPQQIMGSIIKRIWKKEKSVTGRIHHVTVMPCFDKKLEASRSYFVDPQSGEKDVDSVLTPVEIQQMLKSRGVSFLGIPVDSHALDVIHDVLLSGSSDSESYVIRSHPGSGSGGHAENVLVAVTRHMLSGRQKGCSVSHSDLSFETRRNSDFLEIHLTLPKTQEEECKDVTQLRFAIVNGFRNIQTLVQKLKRNKCEFHFVEVMACPSGCLNGGAQLRPDTSQESGDQLIDSFSKRIQNIYKSLQQIDLPYDSSVDPVRQLYDSWFSNPEIREAVFYTEFKAVPKTNNLLTMSW